MAYERKVLDEFKMQLEPAPKEFRTGVFALYLDHVKELDPIISSADKDRLTDLIKGSVFKNIDPGAYDLTAAIEQPGPVMSYSISSNISLFGDALRVADHSKIDVSMYPNFGKRSSILFRLLIAIIYERSSQ